MFSQDSTKANIHTIPNVFTPEEIAEINQTIADLDPKYVYKHHDLGRLNMDSIIFPFHITKKVEDLVRDLYNIDPSIEIESPNPLCVEYSSEYGKPHLPPHYDTDSTDVIIDYQLSSNTDWPLGLNKELMPLQDNAAVIFNPNIHIHWRPHKKFQPGEYVRMIFFRFLNKNNPSDYSYLPEHYKDPAFAEIRELRDNV